MNLNDQLNFLTTPVLSSTPHGQAQGTGFYYQHLSPKTEDGPEWRKVLNTWLVTNRHVVIPRSEDKETIPASLSFHLRRAGPSGLFWQAVTLRDEELRARVKLHPDPEVDVAVVDAGDLLQEQIETGLPTEKLVLLETGRRQAHRLQRGRNSGPSRRTRFAPHHRASLIRHDRQDALDHLVGEPACLRRRTRERLDVPDRVWRIRTIGRPVQREEPPVACRLESA